MRIFLTGGTGFVGGAVAGLLRERGDEVVALVRDRARADDLEALGCRLVIGDLSDTDALRSGMRDCDAVIHGAAIYEVGMPESRRPQMLDTNVGGTERVLDAAGEQGVGRIVYISTVNALGNTEGEVGDESTRHHGRYVSYYDETKHRAHVAALERIERGLPIVIVQPGSVYGPGDHSIIGVEIGNFLRGRMVAQSFPSAGITPVHLEDAARGVLAALDRGNVGRCYILGGEPVTMGELIRTVAAISGKRPPRFTMPAALVRSLGPVGPLVGPLLGYGPNMREMVSAADGVTYWASSQRARDELDWHARPLEEGLRDMLIAEGRL